MHANASRASEAASVRLSARPMRLVDHESRGIVHRRGDETQVLVPKGLGIIGFARFDEIEQVGILVDTPRSELLVHP